MSILEVRGLSFGYPSRAVLKSLSFVVEQGQRIAVIGPNGAGKSTLLKCLCGVLRQGTGEVLLDGVPMVDMASRQRARRIGFVPQSDDILFPFTVRQFSMLGRYPHLSPFSPGGPGDRAAVERALSLTGMNELADRPLDQLSGGERRRATIAAALAQEAPLLLLDEPEANLDPPHAAEVRALLGRLNREESLTLLFVTHDLNYALQDSDKVLGLKDGTIAFFDGPQVLLRNGDVDELYGHPFERIATPSGGLPLMVAKRV